MKIRLYKNVNLTKKDTIKFKARSQQNNYFNRAEIYHSEIEYSSGPIVNVIKMTEKNFYECQNITYARVGEFGGKDYFYFVNDVEFINEDTTYLYVELDYIQTYMFDMEIVDSIVKREHQDRFDTTGKRIFNLEDEPVEVAEFEYLEGELNQEEIDYVIYPPSQEKMKRKLFMAIMTKLPTGAGAEDKFENFGLIPSNSQTYISFFGLNVNDGIPLERNLYFQREDESNSYYMPSIEDLNYMLSNSPEAESMRISILPYIPLGENGDINYEFVWGDEGKIKVPNTEYWRQTGIRKVFTIPGRPGVPGRPEIPDKPLYMLNPFNLVPTEAKVSLSTIDSEDIINYFDSVVFNNNFLNRNYDTKIFTSPYFEVKVKEGLNNEQIYYVEEMTNDKMEFTYKIGVGYDITQNLSLDGYRIPENFLISGGDNSLTKITSEYLNYLRDSKGSRTAAYIGSALSTMAGVVATVASGGALAPLALGGVATGITSLVSEAGKRADMRNKGLKTSNQPENLEYNISNGLVKYRLQVKRPTPKEIDKLNRFFYRYGYTANRVGVPLLEGREDFNYVQAEQLIIKGSIPANDKKTINNLFSDGLRFWHKSENFLDFTVENKEDWIDEVLLNE